MPISKEFNTPELDYVNNSDKNKYLNQKDIINTILNYNRVISKSQNVNPYLHYKHVGDFLKIKDYDICLNIINEKFNKYSSASKNYNSNSNSYFCNMFIMPKEEFFEYCIFLFGVLFECRKQIDISEYNTVEQRVFGYLGEWICGIFFTYIKIKKYLLKELNVIYIKNYELQQEITPAFTDNNIPIIFSCDDNYLPYLAVILHSIKINFSKDYNYDICILYNSLNKENMDKIKNFIQDINISIRFINISPHIYNAKKQVHFHVAAHFKEANYYRFFIPSIFKNYKKIIYLDCDMLVLKDLKDLYSYNFNTSIAACKEITAILIVLNNIDKYYIDFINSKQAFKDISNYIQSGVLVYNISKCIENNFTQKCLDTLKYLEHPPIVDQDVINSAFEGDISFLDARWNFTWNLPIRYPNFKTLLPKAFTKDALKMIKNPYIIHYNDIFKPWNSPHLPNAHLWWHYARQTPFYEEILFKNITQNISSFNHTNFTPQGAVEKVKTHLSYKLGKEILSIKENKLKILILPLLPFTLIFIYIKHKISILIFKLILNSNPNLKSSPLNHYSDYQEALKIQNYLSYKLGNLLIKHPFTFVFRVAGVYREWKENR
ncbi:glycosyltransferase [Campylobacter jejuni]|nr:glycosyltransferase [Campylobacter jejuni]